MSRSQKQVRRVPAGSPKPEGGGPTPGYPDLTQKDGSANVAGDVTKFNTDNYGPMVPVKTDID